MTVVCPIGKRLPAGIPEVVTVTEQSSSAVGCPSSSSRATVQEVASGPVPMFIAGGAVIVGGVVSPVQSAVTVIFCVQLAVRPSESFTVQFMFVTPVGYGSDSSSPSLRRPVTVTPVDGLVVGVPGSTVALPSEPAVAVLFGGQLIVGSGVSVTVMVKLQLPPPVSETTLTTVVPTGKNEPEGGAELIEPQFPEILFVVVKFTIAPEVPFWLVLAATTISLRQSSVQVCAPVVAGTLELKVDELSPGSNSAVALETSALFVRTVFAGVPESTE